MDSNNIAIDGPFKIEANILFTRTGGEYDGYDAWATVTLPPGKIPTAQDIATLVGDAKEQLPIGFRLANRHEFVRAVLKERTGFGNFAVGGPKEFSVEEFN